MMDFLWVRLKGFGLVLYIYFGDEDCIDLREIIFNGMS